MELKHWEKFKQMLVDSNIPVSEVEYTRGNYDDYGKLIKDRIPTLTTDYFEIGWPGDLVYLVAVIVSESFNRRFFREIIREDNLQIYGWSDFKQNFYPANDFCFDNMMEMIKKEKYMQLQFNYEGVELDFLLEKYRFLIDRMKAGKIRVINQLKIDLID